MKMQNVLAVLAVSVGMSVTAAAQEDYPIQIFGNDTSEYTLEGVTWEVPSDWVSESGEGSEFIFSDDPEDGTFTVSVTVLPQNGEDKDFSGAESVTMNWLEDVIYGDDSTMRDATSSYLVSGGTINGLDCTRFYQDFEDIGDHIVIETEEICLESDQVFIGVHFSEKNDADPNVEKELEGLLLSIRISEAEEGEAKTEETSASLYEAVDEWEDMDITDRAVQVGDILLYPGLSVEELIERVESSAIDYDYEYNPSKLVEKSSGSSIEFQRDGETWFTVYAENVFEEMGSLKGLPVVAIELTQEAMPYARFFDGNWTLSDIIDLPYEDLETITDLFGEDFTCASSGLNPQYTLSDPVVHRAIWTEKEINASFGYQFRIDENTGLVTYFSVMYGYYYYWNTYKAAVPDDPSEITNYDELAEVLAEKTEEAFPDFKVEETVGCFIVERSSWFETARFVIFVFRSEDGRYTYTHVQDNLYTTSTGALMYDTFYTHKIYDDIPSMMTGAEIYESEIVGRDNDQFVGAAEGTSF